jgi:hypothetical protein
MKIHKGELMPKKERAVVVTTVHRGVFFGYATDTTGKSIELKKARLCIYWSADLRGFMGLSTSGPNKNCKIGPPANIMLHDITSVVEVEEAAIKAWEEAPWKF